MTPARMIECRTAIGWSMLQLATKLQCSEGTIRNMEAGRRPIPRPVERWLERLTAAHLNSPAPPVDKWLKAHAARRTEAAPDGEPA